MRNRKLAAVILPIFISVILIVVGLILYDNSQKFEKRGVKTDAVIVRMEKERDSDGDYQHIVYVRYIVDGREYTTRLGTYTSSMYVGKTVPIFYMPNNPSDIMYGKLTKFTVIVFFGMGGVIFIIGVIALFRTFPAAGRLGRLKASGRCVEATVVDFSYSRNTRIMEKYPATLVCMDSENNEYKVKFLIRNPFGYGIGGRVKVYVDNANPKKYAVDLESWLSSFAGGEENAIARD